MKTNRQKRIFGMTSLQLGILAVLGLAACGVLGGGLWFVGANMAGSSFSFQPEPTGTPAPTSTLFRTETPTITPTMTPIPYEQLIPSGWNQYTTDLVEIWLPTDFEEIGVEQGMKELIQGYKELGQGDLSKQFEESSLNYELWFRTPKPSNQLFYTVIVVSYMPMQWESLDDFLKQDLESLPVNYRLNDRRQVRIGAYDARRVTLESNIGTQYSGHISYYIYDGTNIYLIDSSAHLNEFYTWAPVFDRIAQTFRVIGE